MYNNDNNDNSTNNNNDDDKNTQPINTDNDFDVVVFSMTRALIINPSDFECERKRSKD